MECIYTNVIMICRSPLLINSAICVFQTRYLLGPSTPPSVLPHAALGLDGFQTEELVQGYVHISIPVTYSDNEP